MHYCEEWKTYPVATNSDVEEEVERALGKRAPDIVVIDAVGVDAVELVAVEVPDNALIQPVARTAIDLETPCLPVLVGDTNSVTDSVTLVADAARVDVAVDGTVTSELAVDLLHDIKLTTSGPVGTMTDRVTEHPESRPDTLLVVDAIATEADGGFDTGQAAIPGSKDILAFNAARAPAVTLAPWDNL